MLHLSRSSAASKQLLPAPASYVCDVVPPSTVLKPPEAWPICAPQLIIAGAEKSGTTSVYEYLKVHPDFLGIEKQWILEPWMRANIIKTLMYRSREKRAKTRKGAARNRALKSRGRAGRRLDRLAAVGVPTVRDARHDVRRWMRSANLTVDDLKRARKIPALLESDFKLPDLESHAIRVRMGKEVRFWNTLVARICKEMGIHRHRQYGLYVDLFPRIPAPIRPEGMRTDGTDTPLSQTWDLTWQRLLNITPSGEFQTVPKHLENNLYKVTGEASPHYLHSGKYIAKQLAKFQPRTRLLFLLRDPVKRFWSQALMIDGMKGLEDDVHAQNPTVSDFEESVLRCLGNAPRPKRKLHSSVTRPNVPGGGAVKRMSKIDLASDAKSGGSKLDRLMEDLEECFSHGLAPFLKKGLYAVAAYTWLVNASYPRDQVLHIPSEELYSSPTATMHKMCDFVGLRRLEDEIWDEETSFTHNPRWISHWWEFTTSRTPVRAEKNSVRLTPSPEATRLLEEFYKMPNCWLQELLGEDWSKHGWKYGDCSTLIRDARNSPEATERHGSEL